MSLAGTNNPSVPQLADLGRRLIAATLPHLRRGDERAIVEELRAHWPLRRLVDLLDCPDDDVVKVAAACLGLVGTSSECPVLAGALHHDDSVVVAMADHALRRIWFRQGPPEACRRLCQAVYLIEQGHHHRAVAVLSKVISGAPWFAEAYNQRAVARYLSGAYVEAIADARLVLRLNPGHFAALAGIGSCFVRLGRFAEALQTYRSVLQIHPRLDGIRQSVRRARALCSPAR